jgi:hypothetical protein
MRRLASLFPLLAIPLACGGGDETSTAAEANRPPPGRAAYVARADAVCADAAAANASLAESAQSLQAMSPSDPGFRREAVAHFTKVLAAANAFKYDFTAIAPPEADRERIEQLNGANEEAIDRLEEVVAELRGDGDPNDAVEAYVEALGKADRLAKAYGFEVCAQIPGE